METAGVKEKILQAGEAGITRLVDRILSRNYTKTGRRRGRVQEAIESLDLPSRDEAELLKARLDGMQRSIEELSARLETLGKVSSCDETASDPSGGGK